MSLEIERKFLVHHDEWLKVRPEQGVEIIQGYLHKAKDKTVRVRIKGAKGFITIKGETEGISRKEFEYEIPYSDALSMLEEFCPRRIHKIRYEIKHGEHLWEVDEFLSPRPELILAEIELGSENEVFKLPSWAKEEVSHDPQYFNANMIS